MLSLKPTFELAQRKGVELRFIEPEKSMQNAFVENANGRLRDERLNEERLFGSPHGVPLGRGLTHEEDRGGIRVLSQIRQSRSKQPT